MPLTAPNSALARVYVIDNISGMWGALGFDIFIDGRTVCSVSGERFAVLDLDPGRHRFFLGGPRELPQDFDLAAGVLYLRVDIPSVHDHAKLVVMDEASAQKALPGLTRVEALLPSR